MARSGSTDGRSGSVIRPPPSCLRVVRELDRLVRREPEEPRVRGVEPVPVVIDETAEELEEDREWPVVADAAETAAETAAGLFTAACPHRLQ